MAPPLLHTFEQASLSIHFSAQQNILLMQNVSSMYPHTEVFKSEEVIQNKYSKISLVSWVKSIYLVCDKWIRFFSWNYGENNVLWSNYRIARQVIRFILTFKDSTLVKVNRDERENPQIQISWASSPLSSNPYSNRYLLSLLELIIICLYTAIQQMSITWVRMSNIKCAGILVIILHYVKNFHSQPRISSFLISNLLTVTSY